MEDFTISIRFHARGGQGGVTAAQLCVDSFVGKGVCQPRFGAERMGSPTESYARLSLNSNLVRTNEQVYSPQFVGILDESLLETIDVTKGMVPGGWIIVNSAKCFEDLQALIKRDDINFCKVDATGLAMEYLGRNITNTIVLGSLVRCFEKVMEQNNLEALGFTMDQLKNAIFKTFNQSLAEKNVEVVEKAYEQTELLDLGFKIDFSVDAKEEWSHIALGKLGYKELDLAGVWYTPGGSSEVDTGSWGVNVAVFNKDNCINCQNCWLICPDFAIVREYNKEKDIWEITGIDAFHCKGCGNCYNNCPTVNPKKSEDKYALRMVPKTELCLDGEVEEGGSK